MSIVLLNYYQNISTKKTNYDSSEKKNLLCQQIYFLVLNMLIIIIARDLSCLFFLKRGDYHA
ncbi:hypothetical protein EQH45_08120 [Streptococcus pneumoniae]|nr:hypothetical protein [Streptococcus pneumoniae]MTV69955.1 hypothetical protein [Streptococcus pneumoniae]OYL16433.1 hypothetical protein A5N52_01040 [Streptococcus pneumoniae]TVW19478.1 hypothetical protein AZK03_01475 [Streptococcus pneumoniae]UKP16540.1 hypothetical protein EQH46_07905 [Streptococcus pneumoniae]